MKSQILLGLALLLAAPPSIAASVPLEIYTKPQALVAVDGTRRLNLFCLGTGAPVVLLDAGAGNGTETWRLVQGEIAKTTRACAYDRAGYGHSDPATRRSDVDNTVDDLAHLVRAAKLGPVIYVGHSIAGLYGAAFATKYPHEVAGVVLIDPSFANQWEAAAALLPPNKHDVLNRMNAEMIAQIKQCAELARRAALYPPKTKEANACIDNPTLQEPLRSELARQTARPQYLAANQSEFESVSATGSGESVDRREVEAAKITFGDKPLTILTHSRVTKVPGLTAAESAALQAGWRAGHAALAKLSAHGTDVVVANSGHYIQIDQPRAVIAAVKRMVETVRAQNR